MQQVNLFLSKTFVTSVGLVATNFLQPAIEDYVKSSFKFSPERHGLPVLYSFSALTYMAWLRYSSDEEGVTYTPHHILGRDKQDIQDVTSDSDFTQ